MIGVDPGPLTVRQICWMADGTQRAEWSHTSSLLAIINNVHCTNRNDMKSPVDFNPVAKPAERRRRVPFKEQIAALKPQIVG